MSSNKHHEWACDECGSDALEAGQTSYTGRCLTCAMAAATENAISLRLNRGRPYDRWVTAWRLAHKGDAPVTTPRAARINGTLLPI